MARTFRMTQWKRWVFSRFLKVSKVFELTTLSGIEFQMVDAAKRKHGWQKLFEFEERPASVRGLTAVVESGRVYVCSHVCFY